MSAISDSISLVLLVGLVSGCAGAGRSGACASCGASRVASRGAARQSSQPNGASVDKESVATDSQLSALERYQGQKTCPVTGEALGSMGEPVLVRVQGHTVYVCCEGCAKSVERDPGPHVAKVLRERAR